MQGCGTLGRKNKAKPSRQLQQLHRFQATRDLFNAIDDLPLSAGWQARGRRQRTRVRALDPANPEKLADYFGSDRGALHPHRRFQNLTLGLQDETSEMGDQAGTAATSRVSFSVNSYSLSIPTVSSSNPTTLQHRHTQATTGTFTMVYDEGIEIRLGNRRIFAFFEYRPKQGFDYHKGKLLYSSTRIIISLKYFALRPPGMQVTNWNTTKRIVGGSAQAGHTSTRTLEGRRHRAGHAFRAEKLPTVPGGMRLLLSKLQNWTRRVLS